MQILPDFGPLIRANMAEGGQQPTISKFEIEQYR